MRWSRIPSGRWSSVVVVLLAVFAATETHAGLNQWTPGEGWAFPPLFAIAVDPTTPSALYLGTSFGVYKSTDGGDDWSGSSAGILGHPVTALAIDPEFPTTLYAGTALSGVFKSTDAAAHWGPTSLALRSGQ